MYGLIQTRSCRPMPSHGWPLFTNSCKTLQTRSLDPGTEGNQYQERVARRNAEKSGINFWEVVDICLFCTASKLALGATQLHVQRIPRGLLQLYIMLRLRTGVAKPPLPYVLPVRGLIKHKGQFYPCLIIMDFVI
jgi:hypothetical protein